MQVTWKFFQEMGFGFFLVSIVFVHSSPSKSSNKKNDPNADDPKVSLLQAHFINRDIQVYNYSPFSITKYLPQKKINGKSCQLKTFSRNNVLAVLKVTKSQKMENLRDPAQIFLDKMSRFSFKYSTWKFWRSTCELSVFWKIKFQNDLSESLECWRIGSSFVFIFEVFFQEFSSIWLFVFFRKSLFETIIKMCY